MLTIFGIRNCDKCRAAERWFESQGLEYRFHDLRADGLQAEFVDRWKSNLGGDALLNKRSQTWRKLTAKEQSNPNLTALCLSNPTLIKRPLVESPDGLTVGYDEAQWTEVFVQGSK